MAEMVGLSHTPPRRQRSILGLFGLIRAGWQKRSAGGSQVHTAEWSDYMLRDVGLQRDHGDDRDMPQGWRLR